MMGLFQVPWTFGTPFKSSGFAGSFNRPPGLRSLKSLKKIPVVFTKQPSLFNWLVVSTHLKTISQNGIISPTYGVKMKNIWNHHLVNGRFNWMMNQTFTWEMGVNHHFHPLKKKLVTGGLEFQAYSKMKNVRDKVFLVEIEDWRGYCWWKKSCTTPLGCIKNIIKHRKKRDKLPINWCKISSINSINRSSILNQPVLGRTPNRRWMVVFFSQVLEFLLVFWLRGFCLPFAPLHLTTFVSVCFIFWASPWHVARAEG